MVSGFACHGCGTPLPPKTWRGGHNPKWCSGTCRRRVRKQTYGDPCVDCGARTGSGVERAPAAEPRCRPCADARQLGWLTPVPRERISSIPSNFWARVEKTDTCWHWVGYRSPAGYGCLRVDGRNERAHRVSYEALVGPIPAGLVIDHLCRNRACVNPDHLEAVTNAENTRRGSSAQKTYCVHGHPYDEANTYLSPSGKRECRTCRANRERAREALAA